MYTFGLLLLIIINYQQICMMYLHQKKMKKNLDSKPAFNRSIHKSSQNVLMVA